MKLAHAWNARLKLRAEGDKLWVEAIIEACGNIKLDWRWNEVAQNYDCVLENGEHYVAGEFIAVEAEGE